MASSPGSDRRIGFAFGAVHIVESLGSDDLATAESVYATLKDVVPRCVLWHVETRQQILTTLRDIAIETKTGPVPLLQIEAHGSAKGLSLSSGQLVTWSDLKAPLTEINIACRLGLVVLVAACHGLDLATTLIANDRAPFWGLAGPLDDTAAADVRDAHLAFFQTVLETGDGDRACRAMNSAVLTSKPTYHFLSAEAVFEAQVRRCFAERLSDAGFRRGADTIFQMAVDAGQARPEMARATIPLVEAELRKPEHVMAAFQAIYEAFRVRFFLEDLYPENRDRFHVSLLDCFPDSRGM